MFFYQFDLLDTFIANDLPNSLAFEKNSIEQIFTLYENKKSNLLSIIHNMMEITNKMSQDHLDNFFSTVSSLKDCFKNIDAISSLSKKLIEILDETILLYHKSLEYNKDEIKANLVEYNKQYDDLQHKISEFELTSLSVINSAISLSLGVSNKKMRKQNLLPNENTFACQARVNVLVNPQDYHSLVISEKEQLAFLPFFYKDIQKIYDTSKSRYETMQDVVNSLYVIPLARFKNSAMSRFKESFRLMREKENASIIKSLDLGLELMFKYELNPIIIAACRNLDELDIYLDCLEENELENFSCFEIKFEVMPQLKKFKNKWA